LKQIKAEEQLKFLPHENHKEGTLSLGERSHLKCETVPELELSEIPRDVSGRSEAYGLSDSSYTRGDYLGIGSWALQVPGDLGASSYIDFTIADLYAVFDGENDSRTTQRGEGSGTANSTQQAVLASQNRGDGRRTERTNSQKRPCRDQQDEDDDEDPDNSKKLKINRGAGSDLNRKLACPFDKNPHRRAQHPRCAKMGFPNIARLK
jgi:hypothetical protein